jgi:hypothetical protein
MPVSPTADPTADPPSGWAARSRAASIHLLLSAVVAALAAALVFGLWYPGAYRHLSGGQSLFGLIVAVDVVLGPLLTFVVFDRRKPRAELARDLGVIAALQLAALGYGVHTLFEARPVHLVLEVDRFRVVSAADVDRAELAKAPAALQRLPVTGPTVIAARRSRSPEEMVEAINAASRGIEISMQPARWMPYGGEARLEALSRAKPWSAVASRADAAPVREGVAAAAARSGLRPDELRLLPVQSRFATWSAVLDPKGEPLALVPIDTL